VILKSIAITILLIGTLFFVSIEIMDMYDSFILFQLAPGEPE
jgi:hypothetical protein